MRVVLEASLNHFTAGELLTLIAARNRSGTLDAAAGEKRARVLFRDGKVIWAEGAGEATPDAIVIELAGWRSGAFRVLDEVALPENAKPVSLDVGPLISEGERRASEEAQLLALYPSDDIVFKVIPQPRADGGEMISLRPDEFQILFQIGGGKPLALLRTEVPKPPMELYRTLHRLQSAGLVAADGAPAAAEATIMAPIAKPAPPAPPPPPTTRATRKTRVSEIKAIAQMKPLIATLTTETGTMHPLLEEETTIGRDERSNTISVAHGSVSSRHARVIRTADGFMIEDLGSRNGTFINSEPVTERKLLADGDIVRLGKILLTFNIAKESKPRDTTKPEHV